MRRFCLSGIRNPLVGAFVITLALLMAGHNLPPAEANFHIAHIDEVMSGVGADAGLQYVEIQQDTAGQNVVNGSTLTFFPNVGSPQILLVAGHDVTSGTSRRWIMASDGASTFLAASGITPDFTFSSGIAQASGMVCWGKPSFTAMPSQYVDCVAYGNYSGSIAPPAGSGTPTYLPAGDGALSLTRIANTSNDLADFALRCPTPQNDANNIGSFGACTTAQLTVSKQVVNNNAGTNVSADFSLHLKMGGMDVAGSPHVGSSGGIVYTLVPGTYTLSEDAMAGYGSTFGGNCNGGGSITLASSDVKTCTITNDDLPPVGGVAEAPDLTSLASATTASDSDRTVAYGIAGVLAAVAVTFGAGWYIYRRRAA